MKRLMSFIVTAMLLSTFAVRADETITVSANSADISEGLDLKVVAKLFAQAKDLEEFENMLNNPDSAFCNLDLNGDGDIDYIRVVEVGEGRKRLIVLQAILAKDIYQDVASIYVEKDEADKVTVQIVGDEYIYGTNYIIEPVYIYQPVIYDWFWGPAWYAYTSPWYWGYYPAWWYVHPVWAYDYYWHHCYAFHHRYSHYCSFRPGRAPRPAMHDMRQNVSRRDYAVAHPQRSFSQRNPSMTNARDMRSTRTASVASGSRRPSAAGVSTRSNISGNVASTRTEAGVSNRTFGSQHTASARTEASSTRAATGVSTRTNPSSTASRTNATTTRANAATTTRTNSSASTRTSAATRVGTNSTATQRPSATTTRTTNGNATRVSTTSPSRSTSTPSRVSTSPSRTTTTPTRTTSTSTYSPSSTRSTGGYGGGGSVRTSGGGGSSTRTSGGSTRR